MDGKSSAIRQGEDFSELGEIMSCPNCGALMNLHAEKPVKEPTVPEGEMVAYVYYCPNCGKVEAVEKPM